MRIRSQQGRSWTAILFLLVETFSLGHRKTMIIGNKILIFFSALPKDIFFMIWDFRLAFTLACSEIIKLRLTFFLLTGYLIFFLLSGRVIYKKITENHLILLYYIPINSKHKQKNLERHASCYAKITKIVTSLYCKIRKEYLPFLKSNFINKYLMIKVYWVLIK